jgi:hypothetical protein
LPLQLGIGDLPGVVEVDLVRAVQQFDALTVENEVLRQKGGHDDGIDRIWDISVSCCPTNNIVPTPMSPRKTTLTSSLD